MKITLWTIQDINGWNELNDNEILCANEDFINPEWKSGYDWMKKQMEKRIGLPKNKNQYPIWAWYQYFDSKKMKPDLRHSSHLPTGTEGVRIEFTKDESEILLSDFNLWHNPHSYKDFIGNNEDEALIFERNLIDLGLENERFDTYPISIKNKIIKSWDKIFNMEFEDEYYTHPFSDKMIQATFWDLRLDEIVKVKKFIAR